MRIKLELTMATTIMKYRSKEAIKKNLSQMEPYEQEIEMAAAVHNYN